tara:strand:- start:1563 stop:2087 length:525 start_codon:yes stop_codon:yes gene_type:complete
MVFKFFVNRKKQQKKSKCDELKECNLQNTMQFVPNVQIGKVIKVYDGDTITIASKPYRKEPPYKFSIRLRGIDCPELRTNDNNEKEIAIIARDMLRDKILHKYVYVNALSYEKYGRLLCNVYLLKHEGTNKELDEWSDCINDWLLKRRLAVKYNGDTKKTPTNWKKYYEEGIWD